MIKLVCLLTALVAAAQSAPETFSVVKSRDFGPMKQTLERLVTEKGTQKKNHFCLLGQKLANGEKRAVVHWREGQAIILWDEPADKESPSRLQNSRGFIDLKKDVVANESEVKGSSYLVTRSWVDSILRDCSRYGERITVKRPPKARKE